MPAKIDVDPIILQALEIYGSIYALARAMPCAYTTAYAWAKGTRRPSPYYRRRLKAIAKGEKSID